MFNRKSDQFDNILNDCLERMLVQGGSIEECLVQYPQQADELRPLLETALAASRDTLAIKPRPEFRARARYQFHASLQEAATKKQRRPFSWQLRWAVMASLTLVLLTGSSVIAAASNSMPDSPLYQVKLATEQVQLFLTPTAEGKAELYAKLADKRVTEIVNMAETGNVRLVEITTERLDDNLTMVANISTSTLSEGNFFWGVEETLTKPTPNKMVTATVGGGAPSEGGATVTVTVSVTVGGSSPEGTTETQSLETTRTDTTTIAGGGTPTSTTSVTEAGGSNTSEETPTVTTTVTVTVGSGGIFTPGETESPTSTVSTSYDSTTTLAPVTTETADTSSVSVEQPCTGGNDLALQLQEDSISNLAALYEALETAPEEVKPALLQAIAVLENGYDNAINANAQ